MHCAQVFNKDIATIVGITMQAVCNILRAYEEGGTVAHIEGSRGHD